MLSCKKTPPQDQKTLTLVVYTLLNVCFGGLCALRTTSKRELCAGEKWMIYLNFTLSPFSFALELFFFRETELVANSKNLFLLRSCFSVR